jgi:hypothetical protein
MSSCLYEVSGELIMRGFGHFYVAKSSTCRVHASVKMWLLSTVSIKKFAKFVPSASKK